MARILAVLWLLTAAQAIHKLNLAFASSVAPVWGRSADAVHLDDFRAALHEKY